MLLRNLLLRRRAALGWLADFTTQSLGALATLPSGLLISRASLGTAQSSASTLLTGIAVDTGRIDTDGVSQGLLVEESRKNEIKDSDNDAAAGSWTAGTGTRTGSITDPAGTTKGSRWLLTSNQISNYSALTGQTSGGPSTKSTWIQRSSGGTNRYQTVLAQAVIAGCGVASGTTTPVAWTRVTCSNYSQAQAGPAALQLDSRDYSAIGGITGSAGMDSNVAFSQVENGALFPTSTMISTGGATFTRAGERLYHPASSALISSARLGLEVKIRPLGSSAQYGSDMMIWHVDASNFASINKTTRVLSVTVAGVAQALGTALPTWVAGDVLEIWCEAGGGSLATNGSARVNGGAKTALGTTAAQGTIPSAGAVDLLCNGTASQFSGRLQRLKTYTPGSKPSWA